MNDLPQEPTPEMIKAGVEELVDYYGGYNVDEVVKAIWEAMLKAKEK